MSCKGQRSFKIVINNPADRDGLALAAYMLWFLKWMWLKSYSKCITINRELHLVYFIRWCEPIDLARPNESTRLILKRYQSYLYHYRKPKNCECIIWRTLSCCF